MLFAVGNSLLQPSRQGLESFREEGTLLLSGWFSYAVAVRARTFAH